jgi:hypothetical protein
MNKTFKSCYYLVLLFTLGACNGATKQTIPADSPFKKSLVQKEVVGTYYLISLPAKYMIKESRGVDFSVYYFYPADTTNKTAFQGGFYLGNAPGGFEVDTLCKQEDRNGYILGSNEKWSVYNAEP